MEQQEIIVTKKEDAERVILYLRNILKRYDYATLDDLYTLVGLPSTHEDHKFGWMKLDDAQVRQTPKGYLLELPPLEEI